MDFLIQIETDKPMIAWQWLFIWKLCSWNKNKYRTLSFLDIRGSIVSRNDHLEKDARRLGQSLIRTGDEDEDDEDYDYDDDLVEMETCDITLTPLRRWVGVMVSLVPIRVQNHWSAGCLCSRYRPLTRTAVAAMPRVQSFQVSSLTDHFRICYPTS